MMTVRRKLGTKKNVSGDNTKGGREVKLHQDETTFNFKRVFPVPSEDWYYAHVFAIVPKNDYLLAVITPYRVVDDGKMTEYAKVYLRLEKEVMPGSLTGKFIDIFHIRNTTKLKAVIGAELWIYIEMNEAGGKKYYNVTDLDSVDSDDEDDDDEDDDDMDEDDEDDDDMDEEDDEDDDDEDDEAFFNDDEDD